MAHGPASIAPLYRTCPGCGVEARFETGEIAINGVLHWSVGGSCSACGSRSEECGRHEAPWYVREALIAAHGEAVLRAEPRPGGAGAAALKTVRELFGVPLSEVHTRLRDLAGDGVKGTEVELRMLAARLEAAGFSVSVQIPEPPARNGRVPGNAGGKGYARWPANPAAQGRPVLVRAPFRAGEAEVLDMFETTGLPMARYLAGGSLIVIAVSWAPDPLAQDPYDMVRPGLATDGTWTWDLAWEHWVRVHGCAPPAEFVAHAQARGFVPAPAATG